MGTYYYATNNDGEYLFDNFPNDCYTLVTNYTEINQPIEVKIDGQFKYARIGKRTNINGTVYTLTFEKKFVERHKLFKELLDMSLISLGPLSSFQNSLLSKLNTKTEEFIHNIKSLNSYGIQDLFALIPQNTLSQNINKQKEIIRAITNEKPNVTVETLLNLIKYNLAMKVEFSVFERLQKPNSSVQKISQPIRSIVLSILQIFISDFDAKNIEVSLDAGEASERLVEVDYDSLFVSLFYLLENSTKYCCPNTKYKIIFKEEKYCFSILFVMVSIPIKENEIEKLKEHGYRSEIARNINVDGKGIGMYRITKTLKLNNAELEITPRVNDFIKQHGKISYEGNQFKIKFIGQQDWFKSN